MALFYFLRHGETEWNAEGRVCGRTDVPLSDAGRRQARLLALRLKSIPVDALYSSPLGRASETASIIAGTTGCTPIVDPRLAELNYGAWEGRTFGEIARADPATYRAWDADPGSTAPPEGETGAQLIQRVTPFLADVALRHPRGNVVVACHKTVCRLLACHIVGAPLSEYRRRLTMENAALNIFQHGEDGWRVVLLNDTSHLSTLHAEHTTRGEDF
jgi:broad specificity phosphatase PhoE